MLATQQCLSRHFPSICEPLLRPRALHLGREQQAATPDQANELTPCNVGHGDFLPDALSARPTGPCSVIRSFSLPQGGRQVLGADLNRSELSVLLIYLRFFPRSVTIRCFGDE